ncbi:hypothetical protein AB0E04_14790 [Streptomyces sp. NPDC048251]
MTKAIVLYAIHCQYRRESQPLGDVVSRREPEAAIAYSSGFGGPPV